jgi:hypothetical protein
MLTIFTLKPLVEKNGEKYVDLTYPSIRYNYEPYISSAVPLTPEMRMRPDLVSRAAYNSTDMWDLIMKYNGYSNPFALDSDDIMLIPELTDMQDQLAPSGAQDVFADSVRKQYIDVSKKAKQDPKLAALEMKRREAQRKKAENIGVPSVSNLPPNIAEEGEREIVIKGGKVFFGPDISNGKQECEVPLSKSEFISKLIKNRIRNGQ